MGFNVYNCVWAEEEHGLGPGMNNSFAATSLRTPDVSELTPPLSGTRYDWIKGSICPSMFSICFHLITS